MSSGPPGSRIRSVSPSTFRANFSSSSRRVGSLSISFSGKSGRPLISSKSLTASTTFLGLSAVTSSTGSVCRADLPILPLPDCCLLACHQYRVDQATCLPKVLAPFPAQQKEAQSTTTRAARAIALNRHSVCMSIVDMDNSSTDADEIRKRAGELWRLAYYGINSFAVGFTVVVDARALVGLIKPGSDAFSLQGAVTLSMYTATTLVALMMFYSSSVGTNHKPRSTYTHGSWGSGYHGGLPRSSGGLS